MSYEAKHPKLSRTARRLLPIKNMIQMILRLKVAPNRKQEIIRTIRAIMRAALLGRCCGRCELYLQVDDPSSLCYTEEWLSPTDLEEAMRSDRFTSMLELMEAASAPPILEFRFIHETRGLEYVAAQRSKIPEKECDIMEGRVE
jgi:quinol monooxygenase YgiN